MSLTIPNGDMEEWLAGPTAPPTGWSVFGAGATIARTTTPGEVHDGTAAAALTRVGTDCALFRDLAVDYPPLTWWQGRPVVLSWWVRAIAGDRAFIQILDDVGSAASDPHSGSGAFERLSTPTYTINGAATSVKVIGFVFNGNTTAQFDLATLDLVVGSMAEDEQERWAPRWLVEIDW